MKKYELTDEIKTVVGHTLHRIRACVDVGNNVKAGDFGGWIESEINLSHDGNAWVHGNAVVCDNAWVHGNAVVRDNAWVCDNAWVHGNAVVRDNAWVCDNAVVCDNAWVCGNAWVHGNAVVCDNAWVHGNAVVRGNALVRGGAWDKSPLYIQGSKWSVCMTNLTHIQIGCQNHSISDWIDHGVAIARRNHADDIIPEYIWYIVTAAMRYGTADERERAQKLLAEVYK